MTDQSLPVFELSPSLPKNVEWKCKKFVPSFPPFHKCTRMQTTTASCPGMNVPLSLELLSSSFVCRAECTLCYMHFDLFRENRVWKGREGKGKKGDGMYQKPKAICKIAPLFDCHFSARLIHLCCRCPALVLKNSIIALLCVAWENRPTSQPVCRQALSAKYWTCTLVNGFGLLQSG